MIARRLQDIWYGTRPPGLLLKGLEKVYRAAMRRRQGGTADQDLAGKAIVVVGNITAGGTGKTPLVIRLTSLLSDAGYRVAVISRGYGRAGRGAVRVDESTTARIGGDEPVLIARRCNVPVYVDTDREAAAKQAFADGAQVVLSDDGLQRVTLPRRMELCVVDGARGFGNGRLLPAGPLREPISRLDTVDTVVINGEGTAMHLPDGAVTMRLRPTLALRLDGSEQLNADELRDNQEFQALTALAGTGNPARFFDTVRSLGLDPQRCLPFDDHHAFRPGDFAGLKGTLLMTEKDAVKCRELSVANAWYLVVDAQLEPAWEQQFLARCEAIINQ